VPSLFFSLLVLAGLGYLGIHRPNILVKTDHAGIHVKNGGSLDALIYRVDGFWYWAGNVALLANLPDIHQRVWAGAEPVKLQIPDIPIPGKQPSQPNAFYMKLAVRYTVPGIPIFRYTTPSYFQYDPNDKIWALTNRIPSKYRSLGKLATGNIDQIKLRFQ
jgi:hypothetical protein